MHFLVTAIAQYAVAIPVLTVCWLLWKLRKPQKLELLFLLLATTLLAAVLAKIATTLHQDPRPFTHPGTVAYFTSSTDNGFPSDHTTYSAVIGFVVLYFSRKLGFALLALALLIGLSRVVGNVHHLQDIVGGFVVAGLSYTIAWSVLRLYHSRAKA
jgi:undecaprenyl-diphosphatase